VSCIPQAIRERAKRPLSRHSRRARRLWRIGVVVALVVACAGLTLFEFWSLRQSLRAHIEVQAQIVADNSEAALVFRDRSAGSEVLSACVHRQAYARP